MVTPFGPTAKWTGIYLRGLHSGLSDTEACIHANNEADVRGKEFARCRLRGVTLTVPVSGGAHALKSGSANPVISEHGKWRREHEGALLAAYGKSPFFRHLMPEIEEIYSRSEGMPLEEFNRSLLDAALGWIEPEALFSPSMQAVREETRVKVDYDLSIFDVIFRLGKEGSFGL